MADFNIFEFIKQALEMRASDIHLRVGKPPSLRISSDMEKIKDISPLSEDDIKKVLNDIMPVMLREKLNQTYDLDFSFEMPDISRFRVNYCKNLNNHALTFRMIPHVIPTFEELRLPKSLEKLASFNNGIIVITGATGTGKSTTIASMIDYINKSRKSHIITIEDPIEFTFEDKKSMITQRQLGVDTPSFHEGIRRALRQDPDVIVIGEIRDEETVAAALSAAETGHLVLATLHTNDGVSTINRLINMFDASRRGFLREQIANTLRATITQKLVKCSNQHLRVPALETLVVTPTIRDFILKDELDEIYELVKRGKINDMITMNMSLYKLYKAAIITEEEALKASDKKTELQQMLRGVFHGSVSEII